MTTAVMANETFTIKEEIRVRASLEKTFASLLAEMGPHNQTPDGQPLPMVLEPRPAVGGTGNWVATTDTCGDSSRASSVRRYSRFGARCSCRPRRPRT